MKLRGIGGLVMKFVLIVGPQAVGKMTVGQELARLTEFKLFHNHMTLEPLLALFGDGPETWRLSNAFRRMIFDAAAHSALPGLIFTYVWAFDDPAAWQFVREACAIFTTAGHETFFVELEAPKDVRLGRNGTPERLAAKPSKRDVAASAERLVRATQDHRLNSEPGEITEWPYLRIDTTHTPAPAVARHIKKAFGF